MRREYGHNRQIILLGNQGTKRMIYFGHGAREAGLHVLFLDWAEWKQQKGRLFSSSAGDTKWLVKIDPPVWDNCNLEKSEELVHNYQEDLMALSALSGSGQLCFFNRPEDILALLDKRNCKRRLAEAGLPVTEVLGDLKKRVIRDAASLLEEMEQRRTFQVFIKPVYGSGAAGAAAFRWQPRTGQMVLYTCALEAPGSSLLVHTKRLRRFTEPDAIFPLLNRLLKLDCLVERWYAKAEYQGYSYDLRAVVQEGHIDFLLARLSKGPITNLQLNNHPLSADALGLAPEVLAAVEGLCRNAVSCYPELKSAGIDILLEKASLKPRVIEMNGQGDLIYLDIYGENIIYRRQAELMKRWKENR